MSIQKHIAITLLGAPNNSSLVVSEELAARGINLLRAAPSDIRIPTHPESMQPRYAMYKGLLPYYIHSNATNKAVTTLNAGYVTTVEDEKLLPLPFPRLALSWTAQISEAITDKIRNEFRGIDASNGGKPIMLVPVEGLATIVAMMEHNPNEIAPAVAESLNISAYRQFFFVNNVISGLLAMHKYSAFTDPDHYTAITVNAGLWDESDQEAEARPHGSTVTNVYKAPSDRRPNTIRAGDNGSFKLQKAYITTPDEVPSAWGRFFAYVKELALPDKTTVPDFIEHYLLAGLAEDAEEIHENMHEIRCAWGLVAKTEAGNILAHICKVAGVALEAQCGVYPLFENGVYRGTVVSGYAWSMSIHDKVYVPQNHNHLMEAIAIGNPHQAALGAILSAIRGNDGDVPMNGIEGGITCMAELHKLIRTEGASQEVKDVLKKKAPLLNFGEKTWAVNINTIREALTLSRTGIELLESRRVPMHHSMLLVDDPLSVAWSCFGGMAPSFKIGSGRIQDLDNMKVTVKRKGADVIVDVSRIGVRNVILKQAIADMEWVRENKKIQNPFGQGQVRASQNHQDRFFDKGDAKTLITALREFAGVNSLEDAGAKRKGGDSGEAGPSKKRKGFAF